MLIAVFELVCVRQDSRHIVEIAGHYNREQAPRYEQYRVIV